MFWSYFLFSPIPPSLPTKLCIFFLILKKQEKQKSKQTERKENKKK